MKTIGQVEIEGVEPYEEPVETVEEPDLEKADIEKTNFETAEFKHRKLMRIQMRFQEITQKT